MQWWAMMGSNLHACHLFGVDSELSRPKFPCVQENGLYGEGRECHWGEAGKTSTDVFEASWVYDFVCGGKKDVTKFYTTGSEV
jgi:hypothetical protein